MESPDFLNKKVCPPHKGKSEQTFIFIYNFQFYLSYLENPAIPNAAGPPWVVITPAA